MKTYKFNMKDDRNFDPYIVDANSEEEAWNKLIMEEGSDGNDYYLASVKGRADVPQKESKIYNSDKCPLGYEWVAPHKKYLYYRWVTVKGHCRKAKR